MKTSKKTGLSFAIVLSILMASCSPKKETKTEESKESKVTTEVATANEVKYEIAKNYFVNNTFKNEGEFTKKINTKEEFNKVFGIGQVMGEDGKATPIDFSKQFVIAVISEETTNKVDYKINSISENNEALTLNYSKKIGEKQSYTSVPFYF